MEQNGLFQFSIDNALEMILIFDESGKIQYANQMAGKLLEYNDELCRSLITDVFPGTFEIENNEMILNVNTEEPFQSLMAYRKNKTCFPVKARILVYEEGQGKEPRRYVCTAYDASAVESPASHMTGLLFFS